MTEFFTECPPLHPHTNKSPQRPPPLTIPPVSQDLHVWSVRPCTPHALKPPSAWQSHPEGWRFLGRGWQLVVNPSDALLPDDIPDEVAALLPGIAHRTELNLEGQPTDKARQLLLATAKAIAKSSHGIIQDPQDDSLLTPAGVKRFVPPKTEKTFPLLHLSWWFLTDALGTPDGRNDFLTLLERFLPEALPKRYGLWEPPQHHYEKTGKPHLLDFMQQHLAESIVWYPHRPVADLHIAYPETLGPSRLGFRTRLLEIQVESAVLSQPGWQNTLRTLWRRMTPLLAPIYAEVRTVHGYVRMGATIGRPASDFMTGQNYPTTTRSWFWRGIPRTLGHAVVLGKEYQPLWPAFLPHAQLHDGFAFASTPDWSSPADLLDTVGPPPEDIALLPGEGAGPTQKYPQTWPFPPPLLS